MKFLTKGARSDLRDAEGVIRGEKRKEEEEKKATFWMFCILSVCLQTPGMRFRDGTAVHFLRRSATQQSATQQRLFRGGNRFCARPARLCFMRNIPLDTALCALSSHIFRYSNRPSSHVEVRRVAWRAISHLCRHQREHVLIGGWVCRWASAMAHEQLPR